MTRPDYDKTRLTFAITCNALIPTSEIEQVGAAAIHSNAELTRSSPATGFFWPSQN
jgi:hypothetical protein